jgi:hypothetical protein
MTSGRIDQERTYGSLADAAGCDKPGENTNIDCDRLQKRNFETKRFGSGRGSRTTMPARSTGPYPQDAQKAGHGQPAAWATASRPYRNEATVSGPTPDPPKDERGGSKAASTPSRSPGREAGQATGSDGGVRFAPTPSWQAKTQAIPTAGLGLIGIRRATRWLFPSFDGEHQAGVVLGFLHPILQ